ncbi:MAG: M12 family metallopeptidase [Granulosicoccus sp.]
MSVTFCAQADDPELFHANPERLDDFTHSLPRVGSTGGFHYEIIQGYAVLEGDILLGQVNAQGMVESALRARGLGRSDSFGRWPDGIVPYLAPTTNSAMQRENIATAIQHWTDRTSITFVERTQSNADQYPNYLRFDSSNSCASYVGMQGGEQSILVSDACSIGSIIHEIGHALGLFHEHTRADRDNFVQIDWEQVVVDKEINFNILNAGVENYGDYDYGSIMHYGDYFFSATGKRTIIAPDGIEIGQRIALSEKDARAIELMYATDLAIAQPSIRTGDEGLEVDLTVSNQGQQGAQQLQMKIEIAEDSEWKGVSRDSGWQCLSYETELRCTRPTMSEQSESRFSLLVDPASGSAEDISILLTSTTHDLNTQNNVINDVYESLQETDAAESTDNVTPTNQSLNAPEIAAAQSGGSAGVERTMASAGGVNGIGLIVLAMFSLGWRRHGA